MNIPARQIRAVYDEHTIRIYQAYSDAIADSALANGTFLSPPFKMTRMTWIKPSFLWMMYRAGWGRKDDGQKRILAIDITREGFEWALGNSILSTHGSSEPGEPPRRLTAEQKAIPVRIQWDPERDIELRPLPYRSIQIGLSGDAVERYVHTWIRRITEVTKIATEIKELVSDGEIEAAESRLPVERAYPTPPELRARLEMS